MPQNFWNNVNPLSVQFHVNTASNYSKPPLDAANPNWQLPPGATPRLPTVAIPAPPSTPLKQAIDKLPSLFNISNGNS